MNISAKINKFVGEICSHWAFEFLVPFHTEMAAGQKFYSTKKVLKVVKMRSLMTWMFLDLTTVTMMSGWMPILLFMAECWWILWMWPVISTWNRIDLYYFFKILLLYLYAFILIL